MKIPIQFIYLLIALIITSGCQPKTEIQTISVPSAPIVKTEVQKQSYEKIYYLDNYSLFEIQSNELNELFIFSSNQEIKTLNSDGTIAFHPIITGSRLRPVNSKLFWYTNINYNANNNLREDVSNNILNGTKLTEYTFEIDNSGLASLKIIVYSNNKIVINRTIDELP